MADQNKYLRYKRDTKHLIYWIIHASNWYVRFNVPDGLVQSSALVTWENCADGRASVIRDSAELPGTEKPPLVLNTTGEIKASALVPTCKLIAKHIKPIPSLIYGLFQSVIAARTETAQLFEQIASKEPDAEIVESNIGHRRFIETLSKAFGVLGGDTWIRERKTESKSQDEDAIEETIFANKFSSLVLDDLNEAGDDAAATEGAGEPSTIRNQKKKTNRKGKSGKRGNKSKSKPQLNEPSLDDVPLESYRIIDDDNGIITEYLMAVYSLVQQWIELRHHVQGLWREVAYDGLNSAVAGTLSNIAIAMIKQTESDIFVDFPGQDSYEIVMKTITRGNPDKAQGMFSIALHRIDPFGVFEKVSDTEIDVKEEFMIHAYQDLHAFIMDFQRTRSGKPTKRMLTEIRNWDPNLDLGLVSKEERIKWRRVYAINWLYDLVNVFSSIVVQRITMKGQKIDLETVDWSINGPWNQHRRLFGLNEFAGDITSLAMQKPDTAIRQKLTPHLVFQMQCILDALTVSRGWSLSSLTGHVLTAPAHTFRPRRDVDLFLDRENLRFGHGYCKSVDILNQLLERDAMMHGSPDRHKIHSGMLTEIRYDFVNWLGESKYMYGLTTIPPSRFTSTNSNGLWEYSPFLCGVGLAEALELSYNVNFLIWDQIPEPICLMHLHNMLVHRGLIEKKVGLYSSLSEIFKAAFFADGREPTSEFLVNFLEVVRKTGGRRATFARRTLKRSMAQTAPDLHGLLNMSANRFFTEKSLLTIFREADYVWERIPEEQVPIASAIAMLRLSQVKTTRDSSTGMRVLQDTPLVNRARASGMTDKTIFEMSSILKKSIAKQTVPKESRPPIPEGYTYGEDKDQPEKARTSWTDLLTFLKLDILNDISGGTRPVSSLNYVWVTSNFMLLFMKIEDKLKDLRNPSYIRAYEDNSTMLRDKRVALTIEALTGEDKECMEVIAEEFQNPRAGFINHIYWDDLISPEDMLKKSSSKAGEEPEPPSCSVM